MHKEEIQEMADFTEKLIGLAESGRFPIDCLEERYAEVFAEARSAWASAVFSERSAPALNRYFDFQYHLVQRILEASGESGSSREHSYARAAALLDHLLAYFFGFLSTTLDVPPAYLQSCLTGLRADYAAISGMLDVAQLPSQLKTCVQDYLGHVFDNGYLQMTTGELFYLRRFISAVSAALLCPVSDDRSSILENALLKLNFNHLLFFQYLRDNYRKAAAFRKAGDHIIYLRDLLSVIPEEDHIAAPRFNPVWASLFSMLRGWIGEEILMTEAKSAEAVPLTIVLPPKIGLNLPVAHLACLIKVLYEVGFYATNNLTDIFKSAACHYSSKRKTTFSQGNISKEYYTVSQQTAARVLDLLQRMIAHLKLVYFPVVAVIGITIVSC